MGPVGPQGPKGDKGAQGEQGIQGVAGIGNVSRCMYKSISALGTTHNSHTYAKSTFYEPKVTYYFQHEFWHFQRH